MTRREPVRARPRPVYRIVWLLLPIVAAHPPARAAADFLTLEDCLRLAAAHNPQIESRRTEIEAREAEATIARAAGRPYLGARGLYAHIEAPPSLSVLGQRVDIGRRDAVLADLGLAQVFYSGGAIPAAFESASEQAEVAAAELRSAAEAVALDIHRAFYDVLLSRSLVTVRQASLDQLAAHADVAAERRRVGDASEYEALRAQVELANHRPLLVEAQNRLLGARDRLTRLLGLDPNDPVDVAGSLEDAAPSPPAAAEQPAANRHELVAAGHRINAAAAALEADRASRRPRASWFAHLVASSPEYWVASEADPSLDLIAGVSLSLSLLEGGGREARVVRAAARLRQAEIAQRDLEGQVALEVRDARRHVDEAVATLAAQGEVIEQAEKALEIARVRYTSGLGTELEVTDAQLALSEARVVRLQALAERAVAAAELRFARGESLYPEGVLP